MYNAVLVHVLNDSLAAVGDTAVGCCNHGVLAVRVHYVAAINGSIVKLNSIGSNWCSWDKYGKRGFE